MNNVYHPFRQSSTPRARLLILLASLTLSSSLAVFMWAGRAAYTESYTYFFLNWNLFLAWIPLLAALALSRISKKTWYTIPVAAFVFIVWLLFLPNAPYLVTDLIHLPYRTGAPVWFDAMMLFTYAWNGLLLGFVSLWIVQTMARAWFGPVVSWVMVAGSLGAAGFGIYLGRFQRWNSWDVLSNPEPLLMDIAHLLLNPLDHPQTVGVTVFFGAFLLLGYLTMIALVHMQSDAEIVKETTSEGHRQ